MWRLSVGAMRLAANSARRASRSTRVASRSVTSLTLMSAGVGVLAGASYSAYTHYKVNSKSPLQPSETLQFPLLREAPVVVAHRRTEGRGAVAAASAPLDLVLFQFGTCPFCCKVRAYLDARGLPYRLVEVDAVLRQAIRWSNYKKVPILLAKTDGGYRQMYDSTAIISILESYLLSEESLEEVLAYYPLRKYTDGATNSLTEVVNKYFVMHLSENQSPQQSKQQVSEREWREWADSHLVHLLSPNVYRTLGEAYDTFEWFAQTAQWRVHFPAWEVALMIHVGAIAMWLISKRLKARHKLGEDVRESLYAACSAWCDSVAARGGRFHGGREPDLADLTVYGVLSSIEGCNAFADARRHTAVGAWYDAVSVHVSGAVSTAAA